MTDGRCSQKDCREIGTHQVWIDLYPNVGHYDGAPAQLFFPDLIFCEQHAKEMKYQDLIYENEVTGLFHHLGRVVPDFSRTQVRSTVIQPGGPPA